jgi:hypothetical protein
MGQLVFQQLLDVFRLVDPALENAGGNFSWFSKSHAR